MEVTQTNQERIDPSNLLDASSRLRQRGEMFWRLVENARDIVYRAELRPRRAFSYVSSACTRVLGYPPEAFYSDPQLLERLVLWHGDSER